MNAVHHCIVIVPSPEVEYFGRAAFREGRSTLAVLAATKGGAPVAIGDDYSKRTQVKGRHHEEANTVQ